MEDRENKRLNLFRPSCLVLRQENLIVLAQDEPIDKIDVIHFKSEIIPEIYKSDIVLFIDLIGNTKCIKNKYGFETKWLKKMKDREELIPISRWQLLKIFNTLRMVDNVLKCHNRDSCLDRDVMVTYNTVASYLNSENCSNYKDIFSCEKGQVPVLKDSQGCTSVCEKEDSLS